MGRALSVAVVPTTRHSHLNRRRTRQVAAVELVARVNSPTGLVQTTTMKTRKFRRRSSSKPSSKSTSIHL